MSRDPEQLPASVTALSQPESPDLGLSATFLQPEKVFAQAKRSLLLTKPYRGRGKSRQMENQCGENHNNNTAHSPSCSRRRMPGLSFRSYSYNLTIRNLITGRT